MNIDFSSLAKVALPIVAETLFGGEGNNAESHATSNKPATNDAPSVLGSLTNDLGTFSDSEVKTEQPVSSAKQSNSEFSFDSILESLFSLLNIKP